MGLFLLPTGFCVVPREKCGFLTLKQATGPSAFFNLLFRMTLTLYPTSSVHFLNCYIIHCYMGHEGQALYSL